MIAPPRERASRASTTWLSWMGDVRVATRVPMEHLELEACVRFGLGVRPGPSLLLVGAFESESASA
jgi:hypothetical protein